MGDDGIFCPFVFIYYLSIRSNHSEVVALVRRMMSWGFFSILIL